MKLYSPLRYPGGKRQLASFIQAVIEENGLSGGSYAEPYAGGASVALHLIFNEVVKEIHINDVSLPIYAFWHSVLNENDKLCKLIRNVKITLEEREKQRTVLSNCKKHLLLEIGFAAFFLNRTSFSGILSAGVLGGKQQSGNYRIDSRFNKEDLINRIQKIEEYKDQINLYRMDAFDFITKVISHFTPNILVYLDPPYYVKSKKLYLDNYSPADHQKIADLLAMQASMPWIVSYDNVPEINQMYQQFESLTYSLNYQAKLKYKGKEVLFFSPKLKMPEVHDSKIIKVGRK